MADELRIVSFGDSVPWGQGLREDEKYDVLVGAALRRSHPRVVLQRLAHSGAIIGAHSVNGTIAKEEVPMARPTILEQCDTFNDFPENVRLVLVNGGINDVDIRTILNPLVPKSILSAKIRSFCGHSMGQLLRMVNAKFHHPECRIIVTGYYMIWSHQSAIPFISDFLRIHGIALASFIEENVIVDAVVDHCRQFYEESTLCFQQTIREIGDPRIVFVEPDSPRKMPCLPPMPSCLGLTTTSR